jgi:hypothetical protein
MEKGAHHERYSKVSFLGKRWSWLLFASELKFQRAAIFSTCPQWSPMRDAAVTGEIAGATPPVIFAKTSSAQ